jgi:hypothetical protein
MLQSQGELLWSRTADILKDNRLSFIPQFKQQPLHSQLAAAGQRWNTI